MMSKLALENKLKEGRLKRPDLQKKEKRKSNHFA